MKKDLPAYCYRRKGGRIYFERRGYQSARIHAEPGTVEFQREYLQAMKGIPASPKGKTFNALIARYRRSPRFADLAPRTKKDYDNVLEFISRKIGKEPVANLRRKDVIAMMEANADAVRFANYVQQVLSIICEHAINLGWLDEGQNPAKGARKLKSKAAPRKAWTDDAVKAYRDTAKGRDLLIFELCLGTGQRIGDVLKMRWNDIQDGVIKVQQGKTGKVLRIPLTARLRSLLARTPKNGLTIVTGDTGAPCTYFAAAWGVRQVRKAIGAEEYDLHSIRHRTANELVLAGCSNELIKEITGHETEAMVEHYTKEVRQMVRAKEAQAMRERNETET